ncbi:MAG: SDR family NAD(P)-dependent oxidoreductase [Candidatus Methylomirabilales bacterium]
MRLDKQVAIVTGAGQGIGEQIALRLGREGAIVVLADINVAGAQNTAQAIAGRGGARPLVVSTDIADEAQVAALVQAALAPTGRIDILVNNSGIMGPVKNVEDITLDEWRATMAVNLDGMFLCCKHVVPVMKQQGGGSIVNIASVTGKRPLSQRTPYAASKMGVIGLTRTLAAEVGRWKIRVNAVCPGAVTGPRQDQVYAGIMTFTGKTREQVMAERAELSALKTFVDPAQVAGVVAFLCSEDAAAMTGQDVNVSAGAVMY